MAGTLTRRGGLDGEGVHPAVQFRREDRINHTMTLDPALPPEGFRHDIKPEMGFPAWPMSGGRPRA